MKCLFVELEGYSYPDGMDKVIVLSTDYKDAILKAKTLEEVTHYHIIDGFEILI